MSFLPHAAPRGLPWYGAMVTSAATHVGALVFFLSGAVALLPEPEAQDLDEAEFSVSLEILSLDTLEEDTTVDESRQIPEDAVALDPEEDLAALTPDADALTPDDSALAPEAEALTPDTDTLLPDAAETLPDSAEELLPEPDVAEPLAPEPETLPEPEVLPEPDLAEADPVQPDALLVPDEDPAPAVEETPQDDSALVVTEAPPAPAPSAPAIDSISPIDDTVLNPLAEATGPAPAPAPLDPVAPAPVGVAPSAPAPVVVDVPDADDTQTADIAPEPAGEELAALLPDPEPAVPPALAPAPEVDPGPAPEVSEEIDPNAAPAPAPLDNPTASDIAIAQLLRLIRTGQQPACTLVLPRRATGNPGVGLSLIGSDADVLRTLATDITAQQTVNASRTAVIDPRQCPALDALRQTASYPASRLGIALDSADLTSGDTLTGRVVGAGGRFLTLLVVDDNGVVQDLAPFTRLDGNTPVFEVPIARAGPTRATRQVIVAIGTTQPIDLGPLAGELAQDAFGALPTDTLETMVFGVTTFDVQ
ncbi:MAG: hypothetical protein AAGF60_12680 [Pseudomonadota bacterium]